MGYNLNFDTSVGSRAVFRVVAAMILTILLLSSAATSQSNNKRPNYQPSPPPRQATARPAPPPRQPVRPGTQRTQPASPPVAPPIRRPPVVSPNPAATNNHAPIVAPNPAATANHPASPLRGRTVTLPTGGIAKVNPTGRVTSVDTKGIHIAMGARGARTTVSHGTNGQVVVATKAHQGQVQGYVQRPYVTHNGHSYVQRTYVENHVIHTVAYRTYVYRGANYYVYAPAVYYRPVFYNWAVSPWPAPVFFSWGWTSSPWYGYYGYYFTPAPAYPSAASWLADYMISADLQAAYAANTIAQVNGYNIQNTAPPDAPSGQDYSAPETSQRPAALSPEVKEAITEEIKAELATEQSAANQIQASGGPVQEADAGGNDSPPALNPAFRIFVVATSLDVTAGDQECTLSPADVITRLSDTPNEDQMVTASVISSQKADCAPGKQILVSVDNLQEMHNHFRQQIDAGTKELAAKQGAGGIPSAPGASLIAGEVAAPEADASADQTLQEQTAKADEALSEAMHQTSGKRSQ